MADVLSLYPLFDTVDSTFLFRPSFPVPPYPIYVSIDQLKTYILDSPDYTLTIPFNGQTLPVPAINKYIMNPAGTIATLTLQLPAGTDKRNIRIATRQRIDALTITALGGASVDWIPAMLPQYGNVDFTFVASLNTWVRA